MTEKKQSRIYRYKFSDDFQNHIKEFSKIHRWDKTSDFKEHWKIWVDDNKTIIELENKRLNESGYTGDILVKMYISARYYFKNKLEKRNESKKRRKYIRLDQDLLELMDLHINRNILDKPEKAYDKFLDLDMSKKYISNECKKINELKKEEFEMKIKKTYKNRFYNIIKMNK
jgi:hypothetical protein|uniref:Uncharacterized protein n=1 Tax=viral metagenome TaxID=1070528 RepID=A0A6C0C566_9ZZZZ